jgi:hypothetical protein
MIMDSTSTDDNLPAPPGLSTENCKAEGYPPLLVVWAPFLVRKPGRQEARKAGSQEGRKAGRQEDRKSFRHGKS